MSDVATPMPDSSAKAREIGEIYNNFGDLEVKQVGAHFFWAITNYNGRPIFWEKIPEYLFSALNRFQDETEQAAQKPGNT